MDELDELRLRHGNAVDPRVRERKGARSRGGNGERGIKKAEGRRHHVRIVRERDRGDRIVVFSEYGCGIVDERQVPQGDALGKPREHFGSIVPCRRAQRQHIEAR